ncbi:MAG: transglycosylase SLT domain-containing protein [Pseudomonas sagittaria]|nr:transglycosylase SLT domain-containing protein [Pseudomonas sagittaria]MCM2329699.1 transglycosylase SLT domain-containing protein [Pseudomonas sagittaria]
MAAPRLMLALLAGLAAQPLLAKELPPPAYQLAAETAGVPAAVLYAVALQESAMRIRGQLRPWPWTLNVAGKPWRFRQRATACQALQRALASTDVRRIDIGLGQINWGYHGQRFASPCAALEPYRNLAVAAQLLREQYQISGDWTLAAGRYHRPAGGAPAARYRAGFTQYLAQIQDAAPLTQPESHR